MGDRDDERPRQERTEPGEEPFSEMTLHTPSQAEGDRDTIEGGIARHFGERQDADGSVPQYQTGTGGQGDVVHTPSQAEGDREEIDDDLSEQGDR